MGTSRVVYCLGQEEGDEYKGEEINHGSDVEYPSPSQELSDWSAEQSRKMCTRRQEDSEDSSSSSTLMVEEDIRDCCWPKCHGDWEDTVDSSYTDQRAKVFDKATAKCTREANGCGNEVDCTPAVDIGQWDPDERADSIEGNNNSPT